MSPPSWTSLPSPSPSHPSRLIYLQGSNGETDIENRLMDTGSGEERVRCMATVTMATYITIRKIDSQWELAVSQGTERLYKPVFSLFSFILIRRLFSSSSHKLYYLLRHHNWYLLIHLWPSSVRMQVLRTEAFYQLCSLLLPQYFSTWRSRHWKYLWNRWNFLLDIALVATRVCLALWKKSILNIL